MPTPELKAPVPWHPSVLLVCPKAAAKILPAIPSDPLWIPLAGFPWPPVIILHSLSSFFSILQSSPDLPSQKKHDQAPSPRLCPGPLWQQGAGSGGGKLGTVSPNAWVTTVLWKNPSCSLLGEEGHVCGILSPVGWWKPALMVLEGALGGRSLCFFELCPLLCVTST